MIRDNEIVRLVKYAESLGVNVSFRTHRPGLPGAVWTLLGNVRTITIYTWPGLNKTDIILNLLHELAHEKAFIMNNRQMSEQELLATSLEDALLTKRQRKLVYEIEKNDAQYRLDIAHELDIRIPRWKILMDIALDDYIYKHFYRHGHYPTNKQTRNKYKKLLTSIKK